MDVSKDPNDYEFKDAGKVNVPVGMADSSVSSSVDSSPTGDNQADGILDDEKDEDELDETEEDDNDASDANEGDEDVTDGKEEEDEEQDPDSDKDKA